MTSERLRLFVAVELPQAWLDAITGAQTRLGRALDAAGAPRLRWAHPEGIHLTLKFLGETEPALLPRLVEALADAVSTPPALRLSLGEAGCFTSRRRVRVVWAGLGGDVERLAPIAGRIDDACAELGFERERRPFAPHLTLARVPEGVTLDRDVLAPHLRSLRLDAPPFEVKHISLMRSHLGPGGARYECIASFPN
ncbi:MAG TPA: RNA 2',3'-cyclic phosphodiesterase [Dehalococcoidia bacterium]|nr:RNA 2',3'-cyclic phosphodiesterase [Dehalococcoidia bacterium]